MITILMFLRHQELDLYWFGMMLTWMKPKGFALLKGQAIADEYGIRLFETTAKTFMNVEEVFFSIIRDIKQRFVETDTKAKPMMIKDKQQTQDAGSLVIADHVREEINDEFWVEREEVEAYPTSCNDFYCFTVLISDRLETD
ncbi:hypothetical protein LXL04_014888 [Taraxacum kok-saghyz]